MKLRNIITIAILLLLPTSINAQKYKQTSRSRTSAKAKTTTKSKTTKPKLPTVDLAAELEKLCQNMVKVEGGKFTMGATGGHELEAETNELPAHKVKIGSFYICRYEVTQALWIGVMKQMPFYFKGLDLPAESVSWDDCQTFIKRLNQLTGKHFRLPTEAEWEYAARGGKQGKDGSFADGDDVLAVAWFDENSNDSTHVVGSKQPNELGFYDFSGNVWEWCEDDYKPYTAKEIDETSKTTPLSNGGDLRSCKVIRGGSWNRDLTTCRPTKRDNYGPDFSNFAIGLRLAATEM